MSDSVSSTDLGSGPASHRLRQEDDIGAPRARFAMDLPANPRDAIALEYGIATSDSSTQAQEPWSTGVASRATARKQRAHGMSTIVQPGDVTGADVRSRTKQSFGGIKDLAIPMGSCTRTAGSGSSRFRRTASTTHRASTSRTDPRGAATPPRRSRAARVRAPRRGCRADTVAASPRDARRHRPQYGPQFFRRIPRSAPSTMPSKLRSPIPD